MNDWEMTLTGMKKVPDETVLESLFRVQIENDSGLREQMAYYDRLGDGHEDKNYQWLLRTVRQYLEKRRRSQTRKELLKQGGSYSVPAVGEEKKSGACRQFDKTGSCARGEKCPYAHNKSGGKPGRSWSPNKPQERSKSPSRGREKVTHLHVKRRKIVLSL